MQAVYKPEPQVADEKLYSKASFRETQGDGRFCMLPLCWAQDIAVRGGKGCSCTFKELLHLLQYCGTRECKPHWLSEPGNLGPIPWATATKAGVPVICTDSFQGDTMIWFYCCRLDRKRRKGVCWFLSLWEGSQPTTRYVLRLEPSSSGGSF